LTTSTTLPAYWHSGCGVSSCSRGKVCCRTAGQEAAGSAAIAGCAAATRPARRTRVRMAMLLSTLGACGPGRRRKAHHRASHAEGQGPPGASRGPAARPPRIERPMGRTSMLYPELFRQLESVRWHMDRDNPWQDFDADLLTDEQAQTIKMNAITVWSALPATEMFLRDNRHDSDFSAFMSIWFFEEQKHSLVLMEYLKRFRPDLAPTEEELHDVRFDFDPAPPLETLMLHFCGEIRLNHW